MIGTSDQSCWLAEACKILLLLLSNADLAIHNADQHAKVNEVPNSCIFTVLPVAIADTYSLQSV